MATVFDAKSLFILALLAVTAFFVLAAKNGNLVNDVQNISMTISHAEAKHGEDAVEARQCFENGHGADVYYYKTDTRSVGLCVIPGKGLAIRVFEKINQKWEEITAYIKEGEFTKDAALSFADNDMGTYGYISYIKP
jgi:hypothetical protein